ncbi:MAG TPA: SRPBCC family protein [Usitatibacteraceae bacterium]|nr:SRPBCC family protein [Usitatibacteraceae bacterium]
MTTFNTSRAIPAPVEQVFAAISDPARLARWWGPAGFTNTFEVCQFRPGGRWLFTMHGPDGQDYPNESRFAEIEAPTRVVIEHVCEPRFRLTIVLAPSAGGTQVSWSQVFERADVAEQVATIVIPANEQNLDRLTAEVLRELRES